MIFRCLLDDNVIIIPFFSNRPREVYYFLGIRGSVKHHDIKQAEKQWLTRRKNDTDASNGYIFCD